MASKRGASDVPLSGPERKRARIRDQRTITVQPGRAGGSAGSGNAALPPTIEVEKYTQARLFEINALQNAMRTAKAANTVRAFQSLPRALRRRAASHNLRRLPTRLRAKALSETPKDAAKPKRKTRKLVGRKSTVKMIRPLRLLRRQVKKVWLETHIWHAKRMHMTEIWGHRLAEKPTEKAFRASYRASRHGALLHDASYFQYIKLEGEEEHVKEILRKVTLDPTLPDPTSIRYSLGTRECSTHFYSAPRFPDDKPYDPISDARRLLGPATVIWSPLSCSEGTATPVRRQALVRVHPLICSSVLSALRMYMNGALMRERYPVLVKVDACEKEYLTFEITGKRATEVVKGVLHLTADTDRETKAAWNSLSAQAGPGSVPKGMLIGVNVYDPRLSFPPKLDHSALSSSSPLQPTIGIARVPDFWDSDTLAALHKLTFSKSDIDTRRSKLLIPGSKLPILAQDQRVPVLLAQRTVSPSPFLRSSSDRSANDMCGWTIMVPAGWGMAFWASLVFAQTRVGGLRERGQQNFEAGAARFPEDFPATKAFEDYEKRRQHDDKGYWERRPPAKRPNYKKLGTPFPFLASFGTLEPSDPAIAPSILSSDLPFLVPSLAVACLLDRIANPNQASPISSPRYLDLVDYLWDHWQRSTGALIPALVRVKVLPTRRGAPEELGVLYRLDEGQRSKLVAAQRSGGEFDAAELLGEVRAPSQIIGRITTGHFSLMQGHGYSVGAISLHTFLRLTELDQALGVTAKDEKLLVLVRNRDSEKLRVATLDLMV